MIAPLLIVQRVANKNALTGNVIISGSVGLLNNGGQGKFTGGSGILLGGSPMRSGMNRSGTNSSGEPGVWVNTTIHFHRDKV